MSRTYLARVTSTGLVDPTYAPNPNSTVLTVAMQSDGSAIIGGYFTTIGGTGRNHIARVTSTGLVDPTFNPNASSIVGQYVEDILIQPDGSVVFGGIFTGVQ